MLLPARPSLPSLFPLCCWAAYLCGGWCCSNAASPCRIVHLTPLTGKVEGTGDGSECGWHIKPGMDLNSIDFWPHIVHFSDADHLSLYSARSGNFEHLATFSTVAPMPVGFTLTGSNEVLLSLQASSNQTRIELDYRCETRGTIASHYLPASFVVLATASALAILCCLMLAYLLCFCRARWRLEHTLQASQVVLRLELPQQLREAEERVSWALEVLPTQRWQGSRVEEPEECCLCLEVFKENDLLRLLPCKHAFHKDCVDRWFASKRYMPRSCPLCKRNPVPAASSPWFGTGTFGAVSAEGTVAGGGGGGRGQPPAAPMQAWGFSASMPPPTVVAAAGFAWPRTAATAGGDALSGGTDDTTLVVATPYGRGEATRLGGVDPATDDEWQIEDAI